MGADIIAAMRSPNAVSAAVRADGAGGFAGYGTAVHRGWALA